MLCDSLITIEPLGILAADVKSVLIILRSWIISKTYDLDLEGQIGLQTCKMFVSNFYIMWNFTFTLELFIDHLT